MTDFQRTNHGRSDGEDPTISALLRTAYAAPTSTNYWAGLEQRVLARVKDAQPLAWWTVFSEWRTAGLVAATLALLLAGAATVRTRTLDETTPQMANGATIDPAYEAELKALLDGDAVTFSSDVRRRLPADAPERYLNPLDW